jgi:hypothetical protein
LRDGLTQIKGHPPCDIGRYILQVAGACRRHNNDFVDVGRRQRSGRPASKKVTTMRALSLLAAASAVASLALLSVSPPAEAQSPSRGGGGSFRGGPPPGGWSQGGPSAGRGAWPVHGGPSWNTNVRVGVAAPGVWWGPGVWRGGWWGPGVWAGGWWGPGPWTVGWWGSPAWSSAWWGPGVWAPVSVPSTVVAPVFIERSAPAEPAPQVWWYWCAESRAYYPYVQQCPGGWQRVAPQTVVPADSPQ